MGGVRARRNPGRASLKGRSDPVELTVALLHICQVHPSPGRGLRTVIVRSPVPHRGDRHCGGGGSATVERTEIFESRSSIETRRAVQAGVIATTGIGRSVCSW